MSIFTDYLKNFTGPGLLKQGAQWAGKKSDGANQVNSLLTNRYNMLTGVPQYSGTSGRYKGTNKPAAPGTPGAVTGTARNSGGQRDPNAVPDANKDPMSELIAMIMGDYKDSKGKSDQLYNENYNTFSRFSGKDGGINPSRIANLDSDIKGFRNIGKYGAADQAGADRLRGGGVYDEFSKTGGYSDADKNNIRDRATSVIPSFFSSVKKDLDRANVAQGGFNPGYTTQMSALARDQGRESQAAARDAEFGIMDRVNEGRRWGTEGMTASESQIVNNMLSGLGGASSTEMGLVDAIQRGNMFGAQGMEGLRTNPGADFERMKLLLSATGMREDQINQLLGMMSGRNPNESNWDKYGNQILRGAGAVVGAM